MQENYILEVQNITKRFAGTVALKDVSMQVFPNENPQRYLSNW